MEERGVDGSLVWTNLISVWPEQQKIERNGCHQVYQEPAPQVVDGDFTRVGHNFVIGVHVGCPKVDQDIHNECNINWNQMGFINNRWMVSCLNEGIIFNEPFYKENLSHFCWY